MAGPFQVFCYISSKLLTASQNKRSGHTTDGHVLNKTQGFHFSYLRACYVILDLLTCVLKPLKELSLLQEYASKSWCLLYFLSITIYFCNSYYNQYIYILEYSHFSVSFLQDKKFYKDCETM